MENQEKALTWWKTMDIEDQFDKILACNEVLNGLPSRSVDSLTVKEVEIIYNNQKSCENCVVDSSSCVLKNITPQTCNKENNYVRWLKDTTVREKALSWWKSMGLEQQFYKTIEHKSILGDDASRHPSTLTGSEIEQIYKLIKEKGGLWNY
jgi:hypothetical protein